MSGTAPSHRSDPLEEVLADLWAAWTTQADLQHRSDQVTEHCEALEPVAAIRGHFAPARDRLGVAEATARQAWLHARRGVVDLDATLTHEATALRGQVWEAWRHDLTPARHAADVLAEGAGRFGQRRRRFRDAAADLTAFADHWRHVYPDLATHPTHVADQIQWPDHDRVSEAINTYVTGQVAAAHPEADQIRQAELDATTAYQDAQRAREQLERTLRNQLRDHGRAAYFTDPHTVLAKATAWLADLRHQLHTATTRVRALEHEPAIRALPAATLDQERDRWADDRVNQQVAAAHQAGALLHQRTRAHQMEPSPSRPSPDRGWGIGR